LLGCGGEDPPYSPRTYYGSVEQVVIKDVKANSIKLSKETLFAKNSKIAVLSFEAPEDNKGGILVSDIFSSLLQQQGFDVVERNHIDQILREQQLIGTGRTVLSDLEIASKLGKLIAADYMVFGAVTLYKSEGQTVYLPILIKTEDRDEYTKEYNRYKEWYLNKFWPLWTSKEERAKILRAELKIFSLEELEDELKKYSSTEFKVIASIGISAKVVNVRDAKIYWMGQAETTDFTLVNGTNRILTKFIEAIQSTE